MIGERERHASVSMGNKLFVIGGYTDVDCCEIFDSCSRKFTLLNLPKNNFCFANFQAVSIGYNIVIVSMKYDGTFVCIYDVINNHRRDFYVESLVNLGGISCVRYHSC